MIVSIFVKTLICINPTIFNALLTIIWMCMNRIFVKKTLALNFLTSWTVILSLSLDSRICFSFIIPEESLQLTEYRSTGFISFNTTSSRVLISLDLIKKTGDSLFIYFYKISLQVARLPSDKNDSLECGENISSAFAKILILCCDNYFFDVSISLNSFFNSFCVDGNQSIFLLHNLHITFMFQ